ncbi:hypothetical protein GCM10020219_037020 [Nonomuraea dietziae]
MRPDACPGALQVHTAADGALARIRIPGGALSATQLREVAACSAELGSGVIELTSRANLQLRGLPSADAPSATEAGAFAARIAAVGLLPSETHERVRNILASPLAGRVEASLVDVRPLVTALDRGLCASPELTGLSGRFLFALDDGTGDLLSIGADVTFLATSSSGGLLRLGGATAGIPVLVDEVVPSMLAAASAFLELSDGTAWRVGDLPDGPALLASRLLHGGPVASRDLGGAPGGPCREIASLRAPDARVVPQRGRPGRVGGGGPARTALRGPGQGAGRRGRRGAGHALADGRPSRPPSRGRRAGRRRAHHSGAGHRLRHCLGGAQRLHRESRVRQVARRRPR